MTKLLALPLLLPALKTLAFQAAPDTLPPPAATSVFQILQREDVLELTLESDFKNLKKNKNKDDYQPARLTFPDKNGKPQTWDVELKPRGKMRRRVCSLPPLKIRFPKDSLAARGMAPYRTLELTVICQESGLYEQFVLREFIAYRLFNLLTDKSFRVQLAKVRYSDTNGRDAPMESFAFFIEHNGELAQRLNGKILEPENLGRKLPNTAELELFCLFEFMIANTDWFVPTAHNMDIFAERALPPTPIPIPYDFDYSGFVLTPYSVPHDKLPIENVSERFYQGMCRTEEETQQTIQLFLEKKADMLRLCQEFPHFSGTSRKHALKVLEEFFEIIENQKRTKLAILKHCGLWIQN